MAARFAPTTAAHTRGRARSRATGPRRETASPTWSTVAATRAIDGGSVLVRDSPTPPTRLTG